MGTFSAIVASTDPTTTPMLITRPTRSPANARPKFLSALVSYIVHKAQAMSLVTSNGRKNVPDILANPTKVPDILEQVGTN